MNSNSRYLAHTSFVIFLLFTILHSGIALGMEKLTWGVNAVVLKSPWSGSPSLEDLLTDQDHTISLDKFYRDGGLNIPATPTECRLAYNDEGLLVVFRCTETNMSFPAAPGTRTIGIRKSMRAVQQITFSPMRWTSSFNRT